MLKPAQIAERIKITVKFRNLTIRELLSTCNLNRNAISSITAGSYPKADNIVKIATVLDVPTDYLMGAGTFENWETILRHRKRVIEIISIAAQKLSKNILSGIDDVSLACLVQAFHVTIEERLDGIGLGIHDPIPTYPDLEVAFGYPVSASKGEPPLVKKQEEVSVIDLLEISEHRKLLDTAEKLSDEEIKRVIEFADFVKSQRKS